jgi:hypothetical protein
VRRDYILPEKSSRETKGRVLYAERVLTRREPYVCAGGVHVTVAQRQGYWAFRIARRDAKFDECCAYQKNERRWVRGAMEPG